MVPEDFGCQCIESLNGSDDRPRQRVLAPRRLQQGLSNTLSRVVSNQFEFSARHPSFEIYIVRLEGRTEDGIDEKVERIADRIGRRVDADSHQLRTGPRIYLTAETIDKESQHSPIVRAASAKSQVFDEMSGASYRRRIVGRAAGNPHPGSNGFTTGYGLQE